MSSAISPGHDQPYSPRQVVLGFFILLQLAFIVVSNLLGFAKWASAERRNNAADVVHRLAPRFPKEEGHGWQWCDDLERNVLRRWSQFSLQDEDWSLFAPDAGKTTGFLAVLLLGDTAAPDEGLCGAVQVYDRVNGHHFVADWGPSEGSVFPQNVLTLATHLQDLASDSPLGCLSWQTLRFAAKATQPKPIAILASDNEPTDIHRFFRFGNFRLRRYEGILYLYPRPSTNDSAANHAQRLTREMHDLVSEYQATVLAYAKWRLKAWQNANPDAPGPQQIIVCQRLYRIHDPEEPYGWDGPFLVPMARWRPRPGQAEADVVLDSYDFAQQRFVPAK